VWQRYRGQPPATVEYAFWWAHAAIGSLPAGARLAVALAEPAIVHWGRDGWLAVEDMPTSDSGLGFHVAVLETAALAPGSWIDFTWRWQDSGEWAGRDWRVEVIAAPQPTASAAPLRSASRAAK
jgi:glucoamylase